MQNTNTNLKLPRKHHIREIKWCWAISISLQERKRNYFQVKVFQIEESNAKIHHLSCWSDYSNTIHIFKLSCRTCVHLLFAMYWRHTGWLTEYICSNKNATEDTYISLFATNCNMLRSMLFQPKRGDQSWGIQDTPSIHDRTVWQECEWTIY